MKRLNLLKQPNKQTKYINIGLKPNNKLNNIIGNSIENDNKYEKRGVYKRPCNNYNTFYIGRTKRNFKTRFNEHRKDFATSTGKSAFSEHILNAGHEMWPMEETMTILHFKNDPKKWKL